MQFGSARIDYESGCSILVAFFCGRMGDLESLPSYATDAELVGFHSFGQRLSRNFIFKSAVFSRSGPWWTSRSKCLSDEAELEAMGFRRNHSNLLYWISWRVNSWKGV